MTVVLQGSDTIGRIIDVTIYKNKEPMKESDAIGGTIEVT